MCIIIFDEFSILVKLFFVDEISEILTSSNNEIFFMHILRKISTYGGACEYPFVC